MPKNAKAGNLDTLNQQVVDLVQKTIAKAKQVEKYGGVLFTLKPEEKEGQFCGVFPYKAHVQLSFSEGTHLDDPEGLLGGSGKGRRHINFKTADDIDKKQLVKWIKQAAEISQTTRPS